MAVGHRSVGQAGPWAAVAPFAWVWRWVAGAALGALAMAGVSGGSRAGGGGAVALLAAALGVRVVLTARARRGRARARAVVEAAVSAGGAVALAAGGVAYGADGRLDLWLATLQAAALGLPVAYAVGAEYGEYVGWGPYVGYGGAALCGAAGAAATVLLSPLGTSEFPGAAVAVLVLLFGLPGAAAGGVLAWAVRYAAARALTPSAP